ncbi:MAG TPA: RNA methyltransferase substrate-binding domain-containing protein, partial [Bellilinea sp.]|nr:RNA methyltransferase substrate-binding domain-containing protein [Bellilinea sp.]
MREFITGRNPVFEVFQAKRRHIFKLQLAQGIAETDNVRAVLAEAAKLKIPV